MYSDISIYTVIFIDTKENSVLYERIDPYIRIFRSGVPNRTWYQLPEMI